MATNNTHRASKDSQLFVDSAALADSDMGKFQKTVWAYYREHGRHDLPWRKTSDPYKILVSEVMLQQTQVPRVLEKYKSFLKKFPTVRKLTAAPLSEVLRAWSGLGHNRRAKYLHDTAREIVGKYKGNFQEALKHALPGVGPYTRAAVRVFAFNESDVLIETNIRAAYIHHFFRHAHISAGRQKLMRITDGDLMSFIAKAAEGQDPRTWHWALMDYGVHIKKLHGNPGRRSAHYTKQSKFEGSLRQVRGRIVRVLAHEQITERQVRELKGEEREKWEQALAGLQKDGLIKKEKGKWRIA